jgi:peptidoglycan/LPS O-acetylase OafA/YrhL
MNDQNDKKIRLHYLDGLRGLAALYVVVFHIYRYIDHIDESLPAIFSALMKFVRYGNFAVIVFIVLSGYCLMLPIARSQNYQIKGTLVNYLQRRTKRILPTYYAALIFSLILVFVFGELNKLGIFHWQTSEDYGEFSPFITSKDFITHLFLVHNTGTTTLGSINAPMWTVAVEWQIYFLFPFLLPIWRYLGFLKFALFSFVISVVPVYLFPNTVNPLHSWYIGLFTLGMIAAYIGFSQQEKIIKIRTSLNYPALIIAFLLLGIITEWKKLGLHNWVNNGFIGLATACLLIYCTAIVTTNQKPNFILKVLESPLAIGLGKFSYSLYLTHGPIITIVGNILLGEKMPALELTLVIYLIALPLSLVFAYLFYNFFERPFERGNKQVSLRLGE